MSRFTQIISFYSRALHLCNLFMYLILTFLTNTCTFHQHKAPVNLKSWNRKGRCPICLCTLLNVADWDVLFYSELYNYIWYHITQTSEKYLCLYYSINYSKSTIIMLALSRLYNVTWSRGMTRMSEMLFLRYSHKQISKCYGVWINIT